MKTLSQIIALVFVMVGMLVLLLGLFELYRAVTNPPSAMFFLGSPDIAPVLLAARLLVGGLVSLQGLMLSAVGLAIWLLSEIAEATRKLAGK